MSRFAIILLALAMICGIGNAAPTTPQSEVCTGLNQAWTTCGNICQGTCANPYRFCSLRCFVGCRCKRGYLLNENGDCVEPSSC
ncbi:hypothetical protein KM043_006414 [Ampulex compressa]|nr:hypothetical protein KM043_006414 [Ampulex compressa]